MKTEKGVTLTALVAYISVFMIIISMVTAISAHFYKNVAKVESAPKYVTEFNKFSMFFVADVKKNGCLFLSLIVFLLSFVNHNIIILYYIFFK